MKASKTSETKQQIFETVAEIASTLGATARLKIIHVLAQAPRSVDALAEITGESSANCSQHLQRLLHEGLVSVKKEKLSRIYRLSDPGLALLIGGLFDIAERVVPMFAQMESCLADADVGQPATLLSVLEDIQSQKALMLDVREEYEAAQSPVDGAISLPLEALREKAKSLVKGKTYYIFCRGRACELASEGVKILRSLGFNAYRLKESPASILEQTKSNVA
jgi:DNA-binding transcriptional ArsR family regulator/rhodanese-related sulfurtransferase